MDQLEKILTGVAGAAAFGLAVYGLCKLCLPQKKVLPSYQTLEERISAEGNSKNHAEDHYAFLISGIREDRFVDDISLTYHTLMGLGYKPQNVYVLDGEGGAVRGYPIDGAASKRNIKNVCGHLAEIIDNKDFLFLYVTDHGERKRRLDRKTGKQKIQSVICLENDQYISESEFEAYMSPINAKKGVLLFTQCYSGGFAKRLHSEVFETIATSKPNELSEDGFTNEFFEAFKNVAEADKNRDGSISIYEAFKYAKKQDEASQNGNHHPFISSVEKMATIILGKKSGGPDGI